MHTLAFAAFLEGVAGDFAVVAGIFYFEQKIIDRVAKARKLSHNDVDALVQRATSGRQFGILGEARVNVLKLNLALDELKSAS